MANYPSNITDSEWNHHFRFWAKLVYWKQVHPTIRDMARLAVGKKTQLLRFSIVKAFEQLASPEFVAMMRVRRSQEESDISR